MKTTLKHIMAIGLLLSCSAPAFSVELVQWERLPIPVPLVKDQERVIFLDKNVRVGVSSQLAGQLRVQSASGALYLLATDEVEPSRLQVQDVETGELILLDIATVPAADKPLEPIRILYEGDVQYQRGTESKEQLAKAQNKALSIPAPVALTRYAAQMLYAPMRTVEPVAGLRQVPVKVSGNLPILPMLPIKAEAVAAFKLGSYTLTAVRIQHQRAGKVELDPRDVQANLYSVAFQHTWLGSLGTPEDTTIAYMITRHGGLEKFLPLALMAPESTQELSHEK
ncbi:MAG: TIGR03749 family integrating conjugative element protein [Pseudomonas sp.]|nr:TIGR03749 family integrating conjugative element protein [Pseudomonas sp.]